MVSNRELIEKAKLAMQNAYAPYSHFQVGAAIVTDDGNVFTGCNIENSSYGATNCAERTAIFKAVSEGYRHIVKVAIVSSSGQKTPPCGICLQVMSEFLTSDAVILLSDALKEYEYHLKDFLPAAFQLSDYQNDNK